MIRRFLPGDRLQGLVRVVRPLFLLEVLVHDETSGSGRQYLERLEEFDDAVFFIRWKRLKGLARAECLSRVGQHGFTHGGEFPVVYERSGVGHAPEFARQEPRIPCEELARGRGLVLIESLDVGAAGVVRRDTPCCRYCFLATAVKATPASFSTTRISLAWSSSTKAKCPTPPPLKVKVIEPVQLGSTV